MEVKVNITEPITISTVGVAGQRGKSAYEVAVDNGFIGTKNGLKALKVRMVKTE